MRLTVFQWEFAVKRMAKREGRQRQDGFGRVKRFEIRSGSGRALHASLAEGKVV